MFRLHVVPHLTPAVMAEHMTYGTGPFDVSWTLEAEGKEVVWDLGTAKAITQACEI